MKDAQVPPNINHDLFKVCMIMWFLFTLNTIPTSNFIFQNWKTIPEIKFECTHPVKISSISYFLNSEAQKEIDLLNINKNFIYNGNVNFQFHGLIHR